MLKLSRMAMTSALIASSLIGASIATAQDVVFATGGYARGGQGLRTMKVMKAMDKDGDHFLSKDEFMAMNESVFKKMDKDGDGKISVEEWLDKQRKSDGG